ncbi:hypothetical protein B0H66DRAFT_135589 [Apodospora peruviana]|uniref:Urease accessory protein UreD n=1 Tax=Apodospora peruviana TaxID=516989 RepID=A0AAE0MAU5_9PEZI|nr:hypothetical protein B0H66DRAFT_135589 [Apodospora peruviana]
MPHKHTRREKDLSTFDLPPSQIAKPLPVDTISKKNAPEKKKNHAKKNDDTSQKTGNLKRKRNEGRKDDAPRAFKRLMAFASGHKTRNGLDDGNEKGKKKSAKKPAPEAAPASDSKKEELTIRPGEKMGEFAQRVDAALPLGGLVGKAKNGQDPLGLKTKRTKKERKMHKMYDEWREQDKKIKEKREEELEELEEREMDNEALGVSWKLDADQNGKKKKSKRGKYIGEAGGEEEDPWEEIKRKRGEAKVGLNEVAEAPPDLAKLSKKKMLVVGGASVAVDDIPKAAGSLAKREELQSIREQVVASYRQMMTERRSAMPANGENGERADPKKGKSRYRSAR